MKKCSLGCIFYNYCGLIKLNKRGILLKNKFCILMGIIVIFCLGIGRKIYLDSKNLEELLTVIKSEKSKGSV